MEEQDVILVSKQKNSGKRGFRQEIQELQYRGRSSLLETYTQ